MLYNSRAVALVIAALVCLATTGLLTLVVGVPMRGVVLVGCVSFSAAFLLTYTVFEFLVFREVERVFKVVEKINKKELKAVRRSVAAGSDNPIRKLNQEIYNMASRTQQEIEELKKIETYRREFLADISHELKTPLFAAQGFIHTLLDGAVDDVTVRDRFLRKAATSLDGLGEMVQELLLLSQLETGVLQMRREPFDLAQLAAEVIEQLIEKAQDRGVVLKMELASPAKNLTAEADRSRIRQVLVNLVENAIKYGNEAGQVSLQLEAERELIQVRVRDNGPGIPPEHLGRIFDRFYRVEKSRNRDSGGIGLGLAIVKQILEAHQARISVTSKLGKGTEFSFRLRRKR